jgi:hypothetical protein
MANNKIESMSDQQRRTYVQKNMDKAWKTYEHWKKLSQKLSTGTWTKGDIELIDLSIEKDG